ncbi:hypothetical protein GIB67_027295 [Kingdonia uniflora]|uniref:Uncharacterized protein n=1 Tax=Kingdonia uniflora TaxID=39325 RepID=A0A7J7KYI2_9MAGN|nr:hypothetical protein GIB67_027295 [Kingdonia uniflora]
MSAKAPIFHAEMQACAACDDVEHYTQDCPLIHEIRETRKDQVNIFHQKPFSFPYNQSHHQGNSSERNNLNNYSGRPYYQGSNSNQNQGGASFTPNHQPFQQNTPYVLPQNRKPSLDDGIQALLQSNNQLMQQFMQMNQQSMSRIETSIVQLVSGFSTRDIDNKVRMPEEKSRKSPSPSTEKVVEGGKPICEETSFVEEETEQVSLSHMEPIYQICANTRMYSSKDELLEKDIVLSNTRVPHGEVIILEDNSWRIVVKMDSLPVNKVSTSGQMVESDSKAELGLEQFLGFPGKLAAYPLSSDAFKEFCKAKAALEGNGATA